MTHPMHVCVLGAGVIGLTTAWALAEAGCQVSVVDAHPQPGQGTSRGNGAQLSYNFVAPLASPETLRHLPALLLERDGPMRLRPSLDPAFLRWGLAFLRACRTDVARRTTAAQLQLAALSRAELDALAPLELEYGRRIAGKLVVYRGTAGFDAARRQVSVQQGSGAPQQVLSAPECLALEPGLRIPVPSLAGGIYTPSEEVGDCGAFCDGLAARLHRRNTVAWHMGQPATPVVEHGRLTAIQAGPQRIEADHFVLSLGAGAAAFARQAGLHLPIQPLKGYSLTVHPRTPAARITHSVTDADRKTVFAPLYGPVGDPASLIRVAGIADLVGPDLHIDPARLNAVRRAASDALDVDWTADTAPWAGLRPTTPDSRPIIGPSPLPGLFLNTGHGGLGWTLACGSARLATALLLDHPPPIDPTPFALHRP